MNNSVQNALAKLFPANSLDVSQQRLAWWVPYAWKVVYLSSGTPCVTVHAANGISA